MATAAREARSEALAESDPRRVGWIGLSVIGVGAVTVGIAVHAAIWFSVPQPRAPEKLDVIVYDYPQLGRLEAYYVNGGPWFALFLAIAVSVFACFTHRNRVWTAVTCMIGAFLGVAFTGLFLHDMLDYAPSFDLARYLSTGPFLAMGGYLVVGIGGVIGVIEVRHADPEAPGERASMFGRARR